MKRFWGILFALVLVFSVAGLIMPPDVVKAQLADTPWPMFRHDLQHTGRSPYMGPQVPFEKWSFNTGGLITSSPAIAADGTLYIGSDDHKLYAINPDGTEKWSFTTGASIFSSPAIGADGTIYIGSWDDKLYAINPNGSLKWSFTTGASIFSSPAIGADGTIYIGSWDDKLCAINPDGTEKWSFTGGTMSESSPAIGADGTIYVGSENHKLYAVNADGTQKWSFTAGDRVHSSPAIGTDGTIYTGSWDNKLCAINPDGTEKWSFATGDDVDSSPAIGTDGTIYIGSWDDKLYAINPNGSLKWSFATGANIFRSSPAIGADGTIYIGSEDNKLYAINPDGTEKWNSTTSGNILSSPAVGTDGTIYVGGGSKLHAIGEAPTAIDISPLFLDQTLNSDQQATQTLTISNIGIVDDLIWSLSENPAVDWLSQTPTSGAVVPGDSQDVQLTFDSTGLTSGPYMTTLKIDSDDPDDPQIQVQVLLCVGYCGPADTPWPMARHDLQRTGRSLYTGPEAPFAQWSITIGRSEPAIGADGTIYTRSGNRLYAINPDGSQKWSFRLLSWAGSSPAVGADGTIYIGTSGGYLYAINPGGTKKWSFYEGSSITSSPAIAANGTIYVGALRNRFYALYPDGSLKWTFTTGDNVESSPAVGADGTIYVGSVDHNLYAINPDGTEKWSFYAGIGISFGPAIAADGTIYIRAANNVFAVNPDGTEKWIFSTTGASAFSSPVIAANGTIYVASGDKLYAINPDGSEKWSFTTGDNANSSPAIGADGTIYVGSNENTLYAINPDGSEKWSFVGEDETWFSPAIGGDGTIYVGSSAHFYAIGEPDVPDIAVDPLSMDLGLVVVGSSSTPRTVTVTNDGSADLSIGAISIADPDATEFSIQNDNCSVQTLAPGASATLEVIFSPTSASGKSATLSIPSNDPDESVVEVALSGSAMQIVPATIDFDPDTLNLKSKGKVVTVYIELPEGYDVEEIDISTVMLNGMVPALAHPTEIGDYDSDGVPDMMVKFDRSDVQSILEPGDEVELVVSGRLTDGTTFEGTDMIRVIEKGRK